MNLCVDVGNTFIKTAVFEQVKCLVTNTLTPIEFWENLPKIFSNYPIQTISIASVGKFSEAEINQLHQYAPVYPFTYQSKYPFHNHYTTPQTLGIDRMIVAGGSVLSFTNQNRLVIDAGTCITYDFVDNQNQYWGGAISPGITIRYQSLHKYTQRLPLLSKEIPENLIGNSTQQSIHSGIINGVLSEIDGIVNKYTTKHQNLTVILTGGDTIFLAKQLKSPIFANPNFLLESLNKLFLYQSS